MSTLLESSTAAATVSAPNRYRQVLGSAVEARRQELGLTIEQAAARVGFQPDQWAGLEQGGWVPKNEYAVHAIAATLECDPTAVSFLALVSRHNR